MAKLIFGDRIREPAILTPTYGAVNFDAIRQSVLLTRRNDNGQWCIPGSGVDPGESAAECCAREVLEETGLAVRVDRLVGVYTSPHHIVEYADESRRQGFNLIFEAAVIGGETSLSDETTEIRYYSWEQMKAMDVMEPIYERVEDAFAGQGAAFGR